MVTMLVPDNPGRTEDDSPDGRPVVVELRPGPHGDVVLRRHGALFQIIINGCFLMDTSNGRSERTLVRAALAALDSRPNPSLLVGGLGVGFSLAEAVAEPRWGRVTVIEREAAILDWHRAGPLTELTAPALADHRTELLHTGLLEHMRTTDRRYDVLCLDIDNGPDWTVTESNDDLYAPTGLALCRERLTPGGVLAVWSARPSAAFEATLRAAGFHRVRTEEIPVPRGAPDAIHLATRPA